MAKSENNEAQETYFEHIRHFLSEQEIIALSKVRLDLSNYSNLKARGLDLYLQMVPEAGTPAPSGKWSLKNSLSHKEIELLTQCVYELQARAVTMPTSYAALTRLTQEFRPTGDDHTSNFLVFWQRSLLISIEDAFRTVNGCESITLPYWNPATDLPAFLLKAPFTNFESEEFDSDLAVEKNLTLQSNNGISKALSQSSWEDFNQCLLAIMPSEKINSYINTVHPSRRPEYACQSLLWFQYSYWDQLWWHWQKTMQANTLWRFKSTIMNSSDFLSDAALPLHPFSMRANQLIDLEALDIGYQIEE